MAVVGDVLRIKVWQSITGIAKPILNVWYYKVDSVIGAPVLNLMGEFVAPWWVQTVSADVKSIQSTSLFYTSVEIDNLMAFETEFVVSTEDLPASGGEPSTVASVSMTYSLQLQREFRTTRNGRKGMAGVPESMVSNNDLAPFAVEQLMSFGETVLNPPGLTDGEGNTINLSLVIAKTPTPPATIPTVFNGVADVIVRGLGTQTTRKQLL